LIEILHDTVLDRGHGSGVVTESRRTPPRYYRSRWSQAQLNPGICSGWQFIPENP